MSSICIATDSTVQFTKPVFVGQNLVSIIPLQIQLKEELLTGDKSLQTQNLPASARGGLDPRLIPPSVDEFRQMFLNLGKEYNEVFAVLLSSHLNDAVENATKAADQVRGRVAVQVIDSQSTSVGLGFLVQTAAEAVVNGAGPAEVERLLRGIIPHIYAIFCIPGLSYLNTNGFVDPAQGAVGEMLNLLPIFGLEDGHLTALEKARSSRHLTDYFQEFLDEFTDLYHISIIESVPPLTHEARTLHEYALTNFNKTPLSEHPINFPLAVLFGPRTFGMVAVEIPDAA